MQDPTRLCRFAVLGAVIVAAGCAARPDPEAARPPEAAAIPADEAAQPEIIVPIFAAADALEESWRKFRIWREMEFTLAIADGGVAIEAVAEGASAGLARGVEIDPEICPVLEWRWQIEALPSDADLSSRAREDVTASLIVAFGDPGVFTNPDPVPTLRYVWSTPDNPVETVVDSPYFPGVLRSIPVRSGPEGLGEWVTERRDLVADYELAFGEPPEDKIEVFALFTDSDHGGERVTARYGWARVLCTEAPAEPSLF